MEDSKLNVKFETLRSNETERYHHVFPNASTLVKTFPGNLLITDTYEKYAETVFNFPLDLRDVWIVTFPKSGTTWVQEMVWLVCNDLDYEGAKENLQERVPFLEMGALMSTNTTQTRKAPPKDAASASARSQNLPPLPKEIIELAPPRYLKTHLPFFLLPPTLLNTCKVVYVARNPKDVCVSFYYHHNLMESSSTEESFETFMDMFIGDATIYSPYWPHVKKAWELRNHPNLHFLFYEELKQNLKGELKRISKFFGKEYSDDEFERLRSHLAVGNFKNNPSVNLENEKKTGLFKEDGNFIRKGKTGDWKNHFSVEMDERFDRWIEENTKDSDLEFKYDLEHQD